MYEFHARGWRSGPVVIASTFRRRLTGAIPRPATGWLIPGRSVHGFGMQEPLGLAALGAAGNVLATTELRPFGVWGCRDAVAVLELPVRRPLPAVGARLEARRYAGPVPGRLVICATPIGNLADAPPRLAEALRGADLVYAEDTRRARILLDHLGVDTPVRSYFVGNEATRSQELADRLANGETVALISDAGTPVVADPGMTAVRAALGVDAEVTTVPGPSAVTAALAVSGLGADRFSFEGFLPRKGAKRAERIAALGRADQTTVFFTTGPRVVDDLADLAAVGGAERGVVVCRELTKAHEEVWHGHLGQAPSHWSGAVRKGEFTVVLEAAAPTPSTFTLDDAVAEAERRVEAGEKRSTAAKDVAREMSVDRGALYDRLVRSPEQA